MTSIGGNLLDLAHTLIPSQEIEFLQHSGKIDNPNGTTRDTYAAPVTINGNPQSVPRTSYKELGLDFNKNYLMVYTSAAINDVGIDKNADRIRYDNKLFIAVGNNDWQPVDGWSGVLLVEVPA